MSEIITIEELESKAKKVIELKKLFDKTFNGNYDEHLKDEHLKLVVMSVVFDAYKDGYKKGLETGINK